MNTEAANFLRDGEVSERHFSLSETVLLCRNRMQRRGVG